MIWKPTAAVVSLTAFFCGCDRPAAAPATAPATSAATSSAVAPAAVQGNAGPATAAVTTAVPPLHRIPLDAVPFSAEVPEGWLVQHDVGDKFVLHGTLSKIDIDILLTRAANVKSAVFDITMKELAQRPKDAATESTARERDGMKIVQEIETQGTDADPDRVPIRWTVRYHLPSDATNLAVYEFNVIGLSKAMLDKDRATLQAIFDSVKPEATAGQPLLP